MPTYSVTYQKTHTYDASVIADTEEEAVKTCFDIVLTAEEMIDEMVDNFTDRFHPQISGFQIVKRYGGGSLSSKDCYEVTEQEEL